MDIFSASGYALPRMTLPNTSTARFPILTTFESKFFRGARQRFFEIFAAASYFPGHGKCDRVGLPVKVNETLRGETLS